MKVVISLGGIFFSDAEKLKKIAVVFDELAQSYNLCVVTGGGERAREYIKLARELGANEALCDYLGIALTRINAKLLIAALKNAYPEPFLDYKETALAKANDTGKIAVMGGVSPGYTTDAVAAILAEYVNADLLLNVTSVDGIYDADPRKYPGAKKYDRLSPKELVALTMKEELKAGSRIVIDPVAAKIIERSGIKTIVINGSNPQNIVDAVHGKHQGTEIV
ncbi:MAG: UMP kinase [Methanophagales archaeon]|nr:UMP kinase [Methanophagales archaeon]